MNAQRSVFLALASVLVLALAAGCGRDEKPEPPVAGGPQVSGTVEGGLRVLTVDPAAADHHYVIYRGDYVRMALTTGDSFTVGIPDLDIVKSFPPAEGEKPYLKFPDAGTFPFNIGHVSGVIEALEYRAAAYREVDAPEAQEVIANLDPVILDVRTQDEYEGGHLENAWLIPVQEIQSRLKDLEPHKDRPVFVYCRSGNRSTVAAKVLVDAGFPQVINLRKGIIDWVAHDLPIVK